MNKLLNKKKAPEPIASGSDAFSSLTSLSETPPLKKTATSRWKRGKKQPEPKPEFNIATALPSSEDFRTSLLMPNLSARFSMLREQDDPNSLLGKASDDSVLQPRRRSRLDFGFGSSGLNDIAEVSSINSSIRPPFAFNRQDSYGSEDGYASESDITNTGSMMGRARPGEGNVLFGGRQKVYKIPMSRSTTGLGKAVYEDDIGTSAFQRYRRERQLQEGRSSDDDRRRFDSGLDNADASYQEDTSIPPLNDSAKDLSHSPSQSSTDKKRSTASSSAKSEARSSTAATSVTSQPGATAPYSLPQTSQPAPVPASAPPPTPAPASLKRTDTKTRRLYEQGLNQDIYDQQTSALSRLNSIQRQRTLNNGKQTPPFLHSAKSASNLHDKPSQPVYALSAQSLPSSAPLAPLTTFGSLRYATSSNGSPLTSAAQSPVSPPSELDEPNMLTQALEPGDRGKATAMGAFNKPAQQFDEKQYLERQQQLQRSQSKAGIRKDAAAPSAFQQRIGHFEQTNREPGTSDASVPSRSRSVPKRQDSLRRARQPTRPYNVFQNAVNQIPEIPTKAGGQQSGQQYDTHRTFFGNISASESEEEEDEEARNESTYNQSDLGYGSPPGRWQPTPLPSVSEHPALRPPTSSSAAGEESEANLEPKPLRPTPSSRSLHTEAANADAVDPPLDSPTLGPSTTEPLNGMVHHLRQKSNQSSIYPNDESINLDEVPEIPDMPWNTKSDLHYGGTSDSESRVQSSYANSNPWDLDEIDHAYNDTDHASHESVSPIESTHQPGPFDSRASSRVTQERSSEVSQEMDDSNGPTWQSELRKQHTRDASTATQLERDAFANELAARRNAIQENIKSIVERDNHSRGVSPARSAGGGFKAFGILKSKPSRESVDVRREPAAPSKAMKMLGINNANASNNALNSQYERSGYSLDTSRPRGSSSASRPRDNSGSRPPMPAQPPRAAPTGECEPVRARGDSETSRSGPSSRARSRSNSEVTSGRSRSRTGPYRDDLERAMVEGIGSSIAGHPDMSPMIPHEFTPKPSPDVMQSPFEAQTRTRSNSRPAMMANYFDPKNAQPIQNAPTARLAPGGPSPVLYSPAGSSARPSPVPSPIIPNPTPPVSGANTPQAASFTPPPMPIIQPRQGALRKKTISKSSISEPTLISSTSNVDTIDLPEGASLKNGMDEPPPLPPINPKRRAARKLFGLGRGGGGNGAGTGAGGEMSDDAYNYGNFGRSKTPDPWMVRNTPEPDFDMVATRPNPQHHNNTTRVVPKQSFENHSTPALQQYGFSPPPPITASTERVERSPIPEKHGAVEGGMF
ncbi:hypothetical protein M433DRAFT_137247 [Acidomyces richmondensis BFW]|nr:MAG: hypothetical protein FE78DRAFT_66404 [Acidomyces sp. 'richmondensis']KYG42450.1 hypothetical protein M433DRAFT_137247 [Acidomyces richmondensis BFW]